MRSFVTLGMYRRFLVTPSIGTVVAVKGDPNSIGRGGWKSFRGKYLGAWRMRAVLRFATATDPRTRYYPGYMYASDSVLKICRRALPPGCSRFGMRVGGESVIFCVVALAPGRPPYFIKLELEEVIDREEASSVYPDLPLY